MLSGGSEATAEGAPLVAAALWSALLLGMAESTVLLYRRVVLESFIWSSRDIVWMAPLGYALIFVPPAAALALAMRRRPGLAPRVMPLLMAALTFVAVAMLVRLVSLSRIHMISVAIVAAGCAYQVWRSVVRRPHRWNRLVSLSLPWLAGVVVVVGGGGRLMRLAIERHLIADLPESPAGAPNILLLILDTVRGENLSLYGYPRPTTPNLERWARRGVVFDRAIAPSSWTLQSHASFFTGRLPHEMRTGFLRPLGPTYPTVAAVLRHNGYRTAGFVANQAYCSYESGLSRGFIEYSGYRISVKQALLSTELGQYLSDWDSQLILRTRDAKSAADVNGQFLKWQGGIPGRPYFAFLNYMEAHLPYRYTPDSLVRAFARDSATRIVDGYDAAIAHLDREIGNLLDTLEARGALRNTIVIVASDHGELLGEHGLTDHGNGLWMQLLRVPLLVIDQRGTLPAGLRVETPVSLRDLAATISEMAGARPRDVFPGRSLSRFWTGGASGGRGEGQGDPWIFAEVAQRPRRLNSVWPNARGPMASILTDRYHLIRDGEGRETMYDYVADPEEARDLAAEGSASDRQVQMRAVLSTVAPPRHQSP